jgi:hypothetical protein
MKKFILTVAFMMALQSVCFASSWTLVEDTYTVKAGDTLTTIAQQYIKKNTYGQRNVEEFIEGIMELNNMTATDIHVGDKLRINYWVK